MSKYINANKLKAEIEQRRTDAILYDMTGGDAPIYDEMLSIIDSLQQKQPEVDLVAEYDEQFNSDPVYGKLANRNAGIAIARHFYELGLKARKV